MVRRCPLTVVIRGLLTAGLALPVVGTTLASPAQAQPSGCVVQITGFAFHPATVAEGGATTLTLTARNCTRQTRHTTLTQYGTEPPGCPVLDPVATPLTFRPRQSRVRNQMFVAPPCAGTEHIIVAITDSAGTLLAKRTAQLVVTR
jgi:hypothetical protein